MAASASAIAPSNTPTTMATNASNSACGPIAYDTPATSKREQDAEQRHGILEEHREHRDVLAVLAHALDAADLLERDA